MSVGNIIKPIDKRFDIAKSNTRPNSKKSNSSSTANATKSNANTSTTFNGRKKNYKYKNDDYKIRKNLGNQTGQTGPTNQGNPSRQVGNYQGNHQSNNNRNNNTNNTNNNNYQNPNKNNNRINKNNSTNGDLNLMQNPETYGFTQKSIAKRPVPKYLRIQPRIIEAIPFTQNDWDKQNQLKMTAMAQGNTDTQGLYEEFQKMRDIERKKMEALGLVDAENTRKDLNDAIIFQGTCLDMCPVFERVRRSLENNVKNFEKDPTTNKISATKAVKAFSRPAAGQPPPLPSEVRPPHILVKTLDYLVDNMVPQLPESHSFLWDRTRSIRQDFTYQNYYGPETIDCNERIVRIHLLCLHIMSGSSMEWSQQQELEQFNKALQTLIEIYEDVRNRGGECPNEAEFRSYYLISHLRDNEVERQLQVLPNKILNNPLIKLSLEFRKLVSQNNIVERGYKNTIGCLNLFTEFFKKIYSPETPILLSCILETKFNEIRFYAVKSMTRSYHTKDKAYDGTKLMKMLGFENLEKLIKFIEYYEIDVVNGNLIDLVNKEKLETQYKITSINEKPKLSPQSAYSSLLNSKITQPLQSFINCGKPNILNLQKTTELVQVQNFDVGKLRPHSDEVKVGSFADFLSRPISEGGFGSGANSMPTSSSNRDYSMQGSMKDDGMKEDSMKEDSMKDDSVKDHSLKDVSTMDKDTNGNNLFSKPKFDFTKGDQVPAAEVVNTPVFNFAQNKLQSNESTNLKQSSSFNFTSAQTNISNNVSEKKPEVTKSESVFPKLETKITPTAPESKPSFAFKPAPAQTVSAQTPGTPSGPTPTISTVQSIPTSKIERPILKKLIDHSKFPQANSEITSELIKSLVDQELNRILPKIIKIENSKRERTLIIESLTKELYHAFLNEIIYNVSMDLKAELFYKNNLKKAIIQRVKNKTITLLEKQELKRKKQNELNEIKFGLKRVSSNISLSSNKRRKGNESIDEIILKRSEIEKLWMPLDLKSFANRCCQNLKILKQLDIKCLVVVENWKINYSKWLNNKLDLKLNQTQGIYEHVISNDKVNLKFTSLPNKDQLNKSFFSNTEFMIFECGLPGEHEIKSIKDKLKRDGMIANRLIDMIKKFGYYKIQIMMIFWNSSDTKVETSEIKSLLNIKQSEIVHNITICDMTQENINNTLINGFDNLSENFKLELSVRGHKKSKNLHTDNKLDNKQIGDDKFKINELKLLNKAKLDKKYSYLNNHSFNKSFNNTMNTINNTFNSTINSTNMNTTHMNSTILDNMSVLGNFGNGIIEESTPFNSPSKTFTKPKLPKKNISSLMELTSRVKSKYRS